MRERNYEWASEGETRRPARRGEASYTEPPNTAHNPSYQTDPCCFHCRRHVPEPWEPVPEPYGPHQQCPDCMPCPPPYPCHPDGTEHREDIQLQLLKSIAEEEAALAHLVDKEARKTQVVAERMTGPFTPDEVIAFQRSVADVLYHLQKKEELLIKKMRIVLDAWRNDHCNEE